MAVERGVIEHPGPWMTRGTALLLTLLLATEFAQFTLVRAEDVQDVLGFRRGDLDGGNWWSSATHLVVHGSVALTLMNAYTLALVGPRLERFWGGRRFLALVLIAALGGWIAHLFVGGASVLLGASAVTLGLLTAFGLQWGREEWRLPGSFTVRGLWLAVFLGSVMLMLGLRSGPGGGAPFLAHLGGIAAAWLFVRGTQVMLVERFREGVSAVPDDPPEDQPPRAVPKTLPRSRAPGRETIDDVVARTNADATAARRRPAPSRPMTPPVGTMSPPLELDRILDKISAEGIERLTPAERRVLDDHSRRLRDG